MGLSDGVLCSYLSEMISLNTNRELLTRLCPLPERQCVIKGTAPFVIGNPTLVLACYRS